MNPRANVRIASILVLVLVWGCGSSDWGTVSGTVNLDGEQLQEGYITFVPSSGGAPGSGRITDGSFTIHTGTQSGLKVGSYVVTVSHTTIPESGSDEKAKLLTPAKYAAAETSDLKAEVKPGSNTFVFEMKSKS